MRLFFGLKPDATTCLAIEHWRGRTLPPLTRPVPVGNLHLTLAFLGEVAERQLEPLTLAADGLREDRFAITLDQLGYYAKPRVLWIGPTRTPSAASRLANDLKHIGQRLGLHTERRQFQAHLTIARRCESPPPASAEPPHFELDFDAFALFQSANTRSGVEYRTVAEWALS